MKKLLVLIVLVTLAFSSKSQTLFVPGGTSGISSTVTGNTNVGIGTNTPVSKFSISAPLSNYSWAVGNGWGDFSITNGTYGLAAGVACGGSGAGSVFLWTKGGSQKLYFGNPTDGVTMLLANGKVGIGNIDPLYQLDVSTSLGIINPSTATNAYSTFRIRGGTFQYGIELAFFGATTVPSSDNYFAGTGGAAIMNVNAKPLVIGTDNRAVIFITGSGAVGIGTTKPEYQLDVLGAIRAQAVVVDMNGKFADYVFEKDYKLMNLSDVEKFVSTNKHLPGIPSAKEVDKNGLNMGEMQNKLLEKVEELTLYMIKQEKKSAKQAEEIEQLKLLVKSLIKK